MKKIQEELGARIGSVQVAPFRTAPDPEGIDLVMKDCFIWGQGSFIRLYQSFKIYQ